MMIDIPLKAKVACSDGPYGQSTAIVMDPKTLQVTYVVVQEPDQPQTQRLVPVEQIEKTGPRSIRLRCSGDELRRMPAFIQTEFRQVEVPRYAGADPVASYAYMETYTLSVDRELVPEGLRAVHPGMEVKASDGPVGRVERLVADSSGQVTHFVMKEGHVWGNKAVVVPLSLVVSADDQTVYLKPDKQTMASMLAIPLKQNYDIINLELVALAFNDPDTAGRALKSVKQLRKAKDSPIHHAATLVKDSKGNVSLHETDDVSSRRGAVVGAISGGLIGLLGGPVGAVVGATAGAVTGRAAAKWIDLGFSEEYLKQLRDFLQPGSSALLLLLARESSAEVLEALSEFKGRLFRQNLTDDMLARLAAEIEQ